MLDNIVTLTSGLGVIQGRWKSYHLIGHIQVPIGVA